jgi:hypothetical protein
MYHIFFSKARRKDLECFQQREVVNVWGDGYLCPSLAALHIVYVY